ncbi:FAD-dependent monooxygenase [Streptomyces sp. MP131-18]|uniref:FAD-dependent monooxygenase n=1 Tax=Streptomyces sp. MP131-18 TaxID=1857892 RepID=UPI00097C9F56|nr:FAD-dependent monooxygenase [Streptomyces sp. MP131-18]ONK10788.1 3-(3-hydroxy-phenyl)propionate/3-hydroxycinnamic acid hydroxylase [Streptomyces sp. MP131-18]
MLPVIIAGAGPVGLALALALAGHGVPTVVLDGAEGPPATRLARTCVLPHDVARWALLPGVGDEAPLWSAWRTTYRGRAVLHHAFPPETAPRQLPQHVLERALRDAAARQELIRIARGHRLTDLEQGPAEVIAHSSARAPQSGGDRARQWRGSHLVGCDGPRSTVRKLIGVPFPGRTDVERFAVAALRADLPWPREAGLHRGLPTGEVTVRPLAGDLWRLDWPLPPDGGLVTPESLLARVHATLGAWHDGEVPAYDLLDTGVHVCHQRLARGWRSGRVFLAGDAAHLLGALGTQQVAEGLRDVDNLAWKLAVACRQGDAETLLDSYQAERRTAVGARLRAVDQALPLVRGRGGIAARLGALKRGRLALLADSHLGRGTMGGPARYGGSPIACAPRLVATTQTPVGAPVADVPVITLAGDRDRLRHRLGGPLLLVLTAPGARVWDAKHWLSAGLMPELAAAAQALPLSAELLVTEEYPGADAHTLLLVRPDGHLAAAFPGADQDSLRSCAAALRGFTDPAAEPAAEH